MGVPPTQTIKDGVSSSESIGAPQATDKIGDGIPSVEVMGLQAATSIQDRVGSSEVVSLGQLGVGASFTPIGSTEALVSSLRASIQDGSSSSETVSASVLAMMGSFTPVTSTGTVIGGLSQEGPPPPPPIPPAPLPNVPSPRLLAVGGGGRVSPLFSFTWGDRKKIRIQPKAPESSGELAAPSPMTRRLWKRLHRRGR